MGSSNRQRAMFKAADRRRTAGRSVTAGAPSTICPSCRAHMENVKVFTDYDAKTETLVAVCDACGWTGTKGPVPSPGLIASNASRKTAEVTDSWPCQDCGATVERFRGESDVQCPRCGASYNAAGNRLRDDWRNNPSAWDENISDLDGYEMQHARWGSKVAASHRPIHEIAREVRQDWANVYFGAVPYLDAMEVLNGIDDYYGAESARSIVAYFLANANTWRGDKARATKAELKAMMNKSAQRRQASSGDDNPMPCMPENPECDWGWESGSPDPYAQEFYVCRVHGTQAKSAHRQPRRR